MEGKRTLVTGAAGFIGSHLVHRLLEEGATVRGLDNGSTGSRSNLSDVMEHERFLYVDGDIRDELAFAEAIEDIDIIFHQAAIPSVQRSIEEPMVTSSVNCQGSTNVLDLARKMDIETVVVASSSAVYGSSEELPKREDMEVNPESPYALAKYWTEQFAMQCSELYGLDTVALRYFNVFGPRQDPFSEYSAVIPNFINKMRNGERPIIFGDGEQSRDFVFVDNVVDANIKAATSDVSGEIYNIACGEATTVNTLVDTLNDILDEVFDPIYDEPRPGEVRHSVADITKARTDLNYEPTVDLAEGLEHTAEWAEAQMAHR